ncbi:MAG: hypothetical protein JWM20_270 [Patescibacteria group bacterium]|nr:hypothetical protein [Patescibacteria group bacterium]
MKQSLMTEYFASRILKTSKVTSAYIRCLAGFNWNLNEKCCNDNYCEDDY